MASAFDTFIRQAWANHAAQPEAVALRLLTLTPAPDSAAQLAAPAQFVVHLPPYERFFAHEALARAGAACGNRDDRSVHVAAAEAAYAKLGADDQAACRPALERLRASAT